MLHIYVRRVPAVVAACGLVLTAAWSQAGVAMSRTGAAQVTAAPVAGAAQSVAGPGQFGAGAAPVLDWSRYATQAVVTGRPPASSEVLLGIVHVAIADTVSGLRGGRPFLVKVRPDRRASAAAAVATAAYDVLRARVPAQQAFLDATYQAYLDAVPDGDAERRGIRLGRTVAGAVLGWRAGDGLQNTVPYVQAPPGPGVWEPTAPTSPVDLVLTQVRPLALRSATQFRPGGPVAVTSARYARDVAEVARLGRVDSTERTAAQTETAQFWSEHTAQQWSRALVQLASDRHLSLAEAARMLVSVHVATADALIGCWDAKYHYILWRPVHAITRAGTDGNPGTVPEPGWQPMIAANHPEYPSGHACFTSAATSALRGYFRTDRVRMQFTSTATGTGRFYERLSGIAADVREARIVSGLHFRHSMVDGETLGARTAGWVAGHFRAAR